MRTLKRSLALVLCIVMVLGLCAFSVSAKTIDDYPDNANIIYREAVQLLSQLGIINGRSTGDQGFDAKAELTRAEGATMIVRMLGISNPVGTSSFSDVEEFYQPYVAYLENLKIVAGYGDGTFGQNDKLTGSAFAKMMLCAAGYDAKREGMLGSQWEIGVAKLIKSTGLDEGLQNFDQTKNINREEAAQIAMNGLKVTEVEYKSSDFTVTTTDGTVVEMNGNNSGRDYVTSSKSAAKNIRYDAADRTNLNVGNVGQQTYYLQFGEDHFPDLTYNFDTNTNKTDDLYRPANIWQLRGVTICNTPKDPVAVFTNKPSESDIAAKLSTYRILTGDTSYVMVDNSNSNTRSANSNYYCAEWSRALNLMAKRAENTGFVRVAGGDGAVYNENYYVNDKTQTPAAFLRGLMQNGYQTEIYAEDGYITDVIVLEYDIAKVNNIVTNSNGDMSYTFGASVSKNSENRTKALSGKHIYANAANGTTDIEVHGTVAKGDYVTYLQGRDYAHIYPTTVVSGAQTSNNGDNKIVVSGQTYTLQYRRVKDLRGSFVNSNNVANYYLDQFGYVVETSSLEVSVTDYAIVERIALVSSYGVNSEIYAEAKLAFTDGSVHTVKVTEIMGPNDSDYEEITMDYYANGETPTLTPTVKLSSDWSENTAVFGQRIVKYENDNGNFKLDYSGDNVYKAKTSEKGSKILTKGVAMIGNTKGAGTRYTTANTVGADYNTDNTAYGTTKTVYIVRTGKDNDPKFNRYVGYASVPNVAGIEADAAHGVVGTALAAWYVRGGTNDEVILAYVNGGDDVADRDTSGKLFFVTSDSTGTYGNGGNGSYAYRNGILGGELKEDTAAVRAKYENRYKLGELEQGQFYVLEIDADGMIDFDASKDKNTGKVEPVANNAIQKEDKYVRGVVTETTLKDLNTLDGYTMSSGAKVYMIEDNELKGIVSTLDGIEVNDHYLVVLKDKYTADNADASTIDSVYIVRSGSTEVLAAADAYPAKVESLFNDNGKKTVEIQGDLSGGTYDVPFGKVLKVNGDVRANVTVEGTLELSGDNDNTVSGTVTVASASAEGKGDYGTVVADNNVYLIGTLRLGAYSYANFSKNLTVMGGTLNARTDATLIVADTLELSGNASLIVANGDNIKVNDMKLAANSSNATISVEDYGYIITQTGKRVDDVSDLFETKKFAINFDADLGNFPNVSLSRIGDGNQVVVTNAASGLAVMELEVPEGDSVTFNPSEYEPTLNGNGSADFLDTHDFTGWMNADTHRMITSTTNVREALNLVAVWTEVEAE